MLIDVIVHADFLCAWCFLDKRSIEKAMYRYKVRHPDVEFRVVWKPYLLYPTVRKGDKGSLYTNIMSSEKLLAFTQGVRAAGTRHGIAFAVQGTTGPSQRGHRLSAFALRTLGPQAQSAVVESLFRGHFEHGKDITSVDWLLDVGKSVGLDEADVHRALRSDDMAYILDNEVQAATRGGIISVPSVLIGGKYRVAGYQESSLFEGTFDRYVRETRQNELALMSMSSPSTATSVAAVSTTSSSSTTTTTTTPPTAPTVASKSTQTLPIMVTETSESSSRTVVVEDDEETEEPLHTSKKRKKGE